jgi:oxysterol-binding protein 1
VQEGRDGNITQEALSRNGFSSSRHGNFSGMLLTAEDQLNDLLTVVVLCSSPFDFFSC